MTSLEPTPTKPSIAGRSTRSVIVLFLLLLIATAGSFAIYLCMPEISRFLSPTADGGVAHRKMIDLERRIDILDSRVNDLTTRLDSVSTTNASSSQNVKSDTTPQISSSEIARIQSELSTLSTAVNGFGASLRETGAVASAARNEARIVLAEGIALIQLRDKAMGGQSFTAEHAAMKNAAKADTQFDEPLAQLAPFAEKGGPTTTLLREELARQASHAEVAIAKNNAQNWWERVIAELRGLISIRPLHGGSQNNDILAAIEDDLVHDDIEAGLIKFRSLPIEAQKVLVDWQTRAEARRQINGNLRKLADGLMAKTAPSQLEPTIPPIAPPPAAPPAASPAAPPVSAPPAMTPKTKIVPKPRLEVEEPSEDAGTDQEAP